MKASTTKKGLKAAILMWVVAAVLTSFAAPAHASVPRALSLNYEDDFSRGLNIAVIQPIHSLNVTNNDDILKMIPMRDMAPTNDGGRVASQIFDRSISSFFASPAVRNSDFGRNAHRVEKAMESNVAIGGDTVDSVKHEFKFAMQPTQTRALVQYRGIANAQLSYQAAGSTMNFEVHERVEALDSNLVYAHTVKPGDATDTLSLRWVW